MKRNGLNCIVIVIHNNRNTMTTKIFILLFTPFTPFKWDTVYTGKLRSSSSGVVCIGLRLSYAAKRHRSILVGLHLFHLLNQLRLVDTDQKPNKCADNWITWLKSGEWKTNRILLVPHREHCAVQGPLTKFSFVWRRYFPNLNPNQPSRTKMCEHEKKNR